MKIFRFLILMLLAPITYFSGRGKRKKLTPFVAQCMQELLMGDILFSRVDYSPSNMFIKGYWSHVAILGASRMIIEAAGGKVRTSGLQEWLFKKDHVLIMRVPRATMSERISAGLWAEKHLGNRYGGDFIPGYGNFYCSEIVAHSWDSELPGIFEFTKVAGVETIFPQQLADSKSLETVLKTK